jgi:hypothetical protein
VPNGFTHRLAHCAPEFLFELATLLLQLRTLLGLFLRLDAALD